MYASHKCIYKCIYTSVLKDGKEKLKMVLEVEDVDALSAQEGPAIMCDGTFPEKATGFYSSLYFSSWCLRCERGRPVSYGDPFNCLLHIFASSRPFIVLRPFRTHLKKRETKWPRPNFEMRSKLMETDIIATR